MFPVIEARATLGGSVDSLETDKITIHSAKTIAKTSAPLYSIHEIESESLKVREYVSQNGTVFAITWAGNRHPDLEPLLGSYAGEFRGIDASTPRKQGARNRMLSSHRLRVQTFGHMRHLRGRAFDPQLVPEGVAVHELE